MIKNLIFVLNISRWYTLSMTFFSWLVIFSYSLHYGGNLFYGLLALLGTCTSHLATNLFDDYVDFHYLSKDFKNNKIVLKNAQKGKCSYILDNSVSLCDVLKLVFLYLLISFFIALFFSFAVSKYVLIFVFCALFVILFYPFLSNKGLSEAAVGVVYGPILFCGVDYVMRGVFDWHVIVLSVPTMIFTINLAFTDNILDEKIDKNENKLTLVGLLEQDNIISLFQKTLLFFGYLSIALLSILDITNWQVFVTFITIPLAVDLMNSISKYIKDENSIPKKRWFHFPMEKTDILKNSGEYPYMFRMYQARNLMMYVAFILSVTINFE